MPRQIPQGELDAIIEIIAHFPEGVSLGQIVGALKLPISLP